MDVFPIILVIAFFQIIIIQKPFPNLDQILLGIVLVVFGLFIFILGLDSALFPIGEKMANEFATKGNALWIILFGFALGFSSTIAEPTLTVVAGKVGALAAGAGAIRDNKESIDFYVWALDLRLPFLWAQPFL